MLWAYQMGVMGPDVSGCCEEAQNAVKYSSVCIQVVLHEDKLNNPLLDE